MFLISILWIIESANFKLTQLKNNALSLFLIVIYTAYPVSLLWSDDITFGIQRSLDLIWILLIAITVSQYEGDKVRAYLLSFIAGASIHALFFMLGYLELFHILNSTPQDPSVSGNRNTYGPIVAVAGVSMIYVTLTSEWQKTNKIYGLILSSFLLITVLLNASRAGHAVLITLAVTGIAYVAYLKGKKILGGLAIGALLAILLPFMLTIDNIQERFAATMSEIAVYEINPLTSTGIRLSFYKNTLELQIERRLLKKLIGSGAGDYVSEYNAFIEKKAGTLPGLTQHKQDTQGWNRHKDLHSQYLMNMLTFGIAGLLLVVGLIILVCRQTMLNREFIFTGLFFSVFMALMINSLSQSAMETRGLAPTYFLILGLLFINHQKIKNHRA